jgi:superoxide reductase
MDRRTMLHLGLAGVSGSLFVSRGVLAAGHDTVCDSKMAGGVYYTKEQPGRWSGKIGGHLPMIERVGSKITVTTGHAMTGFQHYIVKHMVLDSNFQFVTERMFDPTKDAPVSIHDIGKLRETVYVASMCNVHDVWLSSLHL